MAERLIYGINPVAQMLRRRRAQVLRVYVDAQLGPGRSRRLPELADPGLTVTSLDEADLRQLTGTDKHQGVAALVRATEPLGEAEARRLLTAVASPLVLVLDGVQDPRNFGACLRTAEAAGADLVVVGRNRNVGHTPVVSKVAAGAAEVQPVASVGNLARFLALLSKDGIQVIGTDDSADTSLFDVDLTGPVALVLGAEGEGLRRLTRERCDRLARLPMHGTVESLNVAVAAGVCLYEGQRQRSARLAPGAGVR